MKTVLYVNLEDTKNLINEENAHRTYGDRYSINNRYSNWGDFFIRKINNNLKSIYFYKKNLNSAELNNAIDEQNCLYQLLDLISPHINFDGTKNMSYERFMTPIDKNLTPSLAFLKLFLSHHLTKSNQALHQKAFEKCDFSNITLNDLQDIRLKYDKLTIQKLDVVLSVIDLKEINLSNPGNFDVFLLCKVLNKLVNQNIIIDLKQKIDIYNHIINKSGYLNDGLLTKDELVNIEKFFIDVNNNNNSSSHFLTNCKKINFEIFNAINHTISPNYLPVIFNSNLSLEQKKLLYSKINLSDQTCYNDIYNFKNDSEKLVSFFETFKEHIDNKTLVLWLVKNPKIKNIITPLILKSKISQNISEKDNNVVKKPKI